MSGVAHVSCLCEIHGGAPTITTVLLQNETVFSLAGGRAVFGSVGLLQPQCLLAPSFLLQPFALQLSAARPRQFGVLNSAKAEMVTAHPTLLSVPPQTLTGGVKGCPQVKSRETERQEKHHLRMMCSGRGGASFNAEKKTPLAVPVVCSVAVRTAGAGTGGSSSDTPAVAWPWSTGTSSPAALEGDGGLAVAGVQVRDTRPCKSGTRCWTWG